MSLLYTASLLLALSPTSEMADLRSLMKARTAAAASSKRISHPYAVYSGSHSGQHAQLSCSLCSLSIKGEVLWASHLTSKVHRINVRREKERDRVELELTRKRAAEVLEEEQEQEETTKRVRFEDSQGKENDGVNDEYHQPQTGPGPSSVPAFLPPGFFDDPSKAISSLPTRTTDGDPDADIPYQQQRDAEPVDEEWAAFEATLAAPVPDEAEASTSTSMSGPSPFALAAATISAEEVLYDDQDRRDGEDGANANGRAPAMEDEELEEEEHEEPKETEEERREREEREELMMRIETCAH